MVGHTIQEGGITSACQGRVLRIDVGLSRGCGDGSPEVRLVHAGWWTGAMPRSASAGTCFGAMQLCMAAGVLCLSQL